ncbi:MAG: hypothetical protein WBQ37_09425 [Candidatus Competibacter sp.]
MDDEIYFEIVGQELRSGLLREGLWVKALSAAVGNENLARSLYIKMRAQQLIDLDREIKQQEAMRAQQLANSAEEAKRREAINRTVNDVKKASAGLVVGLGKIIFNLSGFLFGLLALVGLFFVSIDWTIGLVIIIISGLISYWCFNEAR